VVLVSNKKESSDNNSDSSDNIRKIFYNSSQYAEFYDIRVIKDETSGKFFVVWFVPDKNGNYKPSWLSPRYTTHILGEAQSQPVLSNPQRYDFERILIHPMRWSVSDEVMQNIANVVTGKMDEKSNLTLGDFGSVKKWLADHPNAKYGFPPPASPPSRMTMQPQYSTSNPRPLAQYEKVYNIYPPVDSIAYSGLMQFVIGRSTEYLTHNSYTTRNQEVPLSSNTGYIEHVFKKGSIDPHITIVNKRTEKLNNQAGARTEAAAKILQTSTEIITSATRKVNVHTFDIGDGYYFFEVENQFILFSTQGVPLVADVNLIRGIDILIWLGFGDKGK
jgi:hypothetical protein